MKIYWKIVRDAVEFKISVTSVSASVSVSANSASICSVSANCVAIDLDHPFTKCLGLAFRPVSRPAPLPLLVSSAILPALRSMPEL